MKKFLLLSLISIIFTVLSALIGLPAYAADCSAPGGVSCNATFTDTCPDDCHSDNWHCDKTINKCLMNGTNAPTPTTTPNPTPTFCTNGTYDPKTGTCTSVDTAFGQLGTSAPDLIKTLFGIILSVAGGIAVVLIIISGYRMILSQGNPEKLQEAREMLTSAIIGLLFIIFSVVILQLIGVTVLHIPGFGGPTSSSTSSGGGGSKQFFQ